MSVLHIEKDLVVLVPCNNTKFTMIGLLSRFHSLRIRQLTYDIFVHPERDPGCLLRGHEFLRTLINKYRYALILLDYVGCGHESSPPEELEKDLEEKLFQSGWDNRSAVIIIRPELDIWVWSRSSHVDIELGWSDKEPDLRTWLMENGYIDNRYSKPEHPKEVLEKILWLTKKPRSS